MRRKITILIILLGMIAHTPWWFSAVLILGAIWRFDSGYELLFLTAVADLTYGSPDRHFIGLAFPATFLLAIVITLIRTLNRQLFLSANT